MILFLFIFCAPSTWTVLTLAADRPPSDLVTCSPGFLSRFLARIKGGPSSATNGLQGERGQRKESNPIIEHFRGELENWRAGRPSNYQRALLEAALNVAIRQHQEGRSLVYPLETDQSLRTLATFNEDVLIEQRWRGFVASLTDLPSYTNVELKRVMQGQSQTAYRVTIGGETYYFRYGIDPLAYHTAVDALITGAVRKSMAAWILNQQMGLNLVPRHELVRLNGEVGILSREARGRSGAEFLAESNQLPQGVHLANQQAFQVLVNNIDVTPSNLRIDPESGVIQVFDYDQAFALNFARSHWFADTAIGGYLPTPIPAYFVQRLQSLDPEQLTSRLRSYLTENELQGLWFRRLVILEYARLATVTRRHESLR